MYLRGRLPFHCSQAQDRDRDRCVRDFPLDLPSSQVILFLLFARLPGPLQPNLREAGLLVEYLVRRLRVE